MLEFAPPWVKKSIWYIGPVVLILMLIGFGDKIPFVADVKLFFKGWMSEKQRDGWEKDIQSLQAKIDSTNNAVSIVIKRNDSLAVEMKNIMVSIDKRIKSIDSLKKVVKTMESQRIAQEDKEKVDDSKITDVNHFVDSLLTYRDSLSRANGLQFRR